MKDVVQDALRGNPEEAKEETAVITAEEALKVVKADEQRLEDWRRQFPESLSEAEELAICLRRVNAFSEIYFLGFFQYEINLGQEDVTVFARRKVNYARINGDQPATLQMGLLNKFLGSVKTRSNKMWEIAQRRGDGRKRNQASRSRSQEPAPLASNPKATPKAPVINKKQAGSFDGGTNKKARVETKENVLQLAALRRERTKLPPLPPAPYTLPVRPLQLTEGRNPEFTNYDRWNEAAPPLVNRVELTEKLCPHVGIDVSSFMADLLDQRATISYRLGVDMFTMMASKDPMCVADSMRTQANVIGLMEEKKCSLIVQLVYDLEVLRAEHANDMQRREEAERALVETNAKMEATIKQRVSESLEKSLTRKRKETKMEKEHGDKYKDKHYKALTQIKNLETNLKQAKLDVKEKEKKVTTLSQEYDKQAKIIKDKFINETTLEKKAKLHLDLQQKTKASKAKPVKRVEEAESKLATSVKALEESQKRIIEMEGESMKLKGCLQDQEA
uniref:Uncharacterized protein n=1 Tax=Cannabis sativa TaxID=3483 RepID=A0A803P5E6_CANSA